MVVAQAVKVVYVITSSSINCFRLLWVVQVANVAFVFVEVMVGVTKFSLLLLLFKVVSIFLGCSNCFNSFHIYVFLRMFCVVFRCLVCFSFLLCSGLCSVVFGRLNSVSCLRLFMFVL